MFLDRYTIFSVIRFFFQNKILSTISRSYILDLNIEINQIKFKNVSLYATIISIYPLISINKF